MRFNFNFADPTPELQPRSLTPKEEAQWLPLQNHPVFSLSAAAAGPSAPTNSPAPRNLLAWDGSSRLYFWDNEQRCLHRISVRLGEPEPTSVLAASPSKVLRADTEIKFAVDKISINRNGSALLLEGSDALCVMYLYGRSSAADDIICRTVLVGSEVYLNGSNALRVLRASWHPYSDNHLGVLSSDSVFRLFDLSANAMQPEQEFYLQPVEPGKSKKAASICTVDFYFGGDHLWDRFSVFVLFADGSVYILCPIVPFKSAHKWQSILEIYGDAHTYGLKSTNPAAARNSSMAISWLEATFPELAQQEAEGGNPATVKAHPYALFDASLSLQGPLHKASHGREDDLAVRGAECEGCAVSFLYNLVSKDSILVTAWSGGQLQVDALADEIQPVWNIGSPPRLRVDSFDCILGLAMICESNPEEPSKGNVIKPLEHTIWLGQPPPLLRLAIVDLALPQQTNSDAQIMMFTDPLVPERIYALHTGGIDSIVLHFLPFTSQANGKEEVVRTPSINPVLSTCLEETSSPAPLCGALSLSDSFGYSWIVGVTSSRDCIVLEMKTWDVLLPVGVDTEKKDISLDKSKEMETPAMISKELISGPRVVLVPQTPSNQRSVAADSIEGRSILHQYFKIFHENYVEYAHKVYFEVKHHAPQLKRIIDDQHARLVEAQDRLLKVERKQMELDERMDHAIQQHEILDERLKCLRKLPVAHKKPLSRAERDFKSELDHFAGVEMDALHSSIDSISARLRRYTQLTKKEQTLRKKSLVQDNQISQLKSSLEKLSLVNNDNLKKVKLVEKAISSKAKQ
ncbi:hypothetical protein BT93_J0775 [Corymbia citriodora subsp. variegata]|nr:hypothetical protein BT93_J0775 [Corymbia citriodora subsp. variegata]